MLLKARFVLQTVWERGCKEVVTVRRTGAAAGSGAGVALGAAYLPIILLILRRTAPRCVCSNKMLREGGHADMVRCRRSCARTQWHHGCRLWRSERSAWER